VSRAATSTDALAPVPPVPEHRLSANGKLVDDRG
jgi:hypothetical protein